MKNNIIWHLLNASHRTHVGSDEFRRVGLLQVQLTVEQKLHVGLQYNKWVCSSISVFSVGLDLSGYSFVGKVWIQLDIHFKKFFFLIIRLGLYY